MRTICTSLTVSLLAFCMGSCVIYGTQHRPANAATFNELKDARTWTLQSGTGLVRFVMIDAVNSDSIKATIGDLPRKHDHPPGNPRRYSRSFGTYSKKVAHLVVAEGISLDGTAVKLSYQDMKDVSVHNVSGLTVLVSLGLVALYFAMASLLISGAYSY